MYDYTVSYRRIPEHIIPDKRLNRHVRHDSRSLAYRYHRTMAPGPAPMRTSVIDRYIPILNQGNVGSCTENAGVGALGSGSLFLALTLAERATLGEDLAVAMYSDEELLLYGTGYPPTDNGGDGLTACRVMQSRSFISGYTHCLNLSDVLTAINDGNAVMIGSNWYDSMDQPDSSGLVTISPNAGVRGGHEYLARGVNVEEQLVLLDNSWGDGYGDRGSFEYSWDTLTRLLSEEGDGTVPIAITAPAPVPAVAA